MSDAQENKATVQDENVMLRLKATDTFHKKKMSEFREELARSPPSSSSSDKPATKRALLESAVSGMTDMVESVERSSTALLKALGEQNDLQKAEHESRDLFRQRQLQAIASEEVYRKMKGLFMSCDSGVLSEQQFGAAMEKDAV